MDLSASAAREACDRRWHPRADRALGAREPKLGLPPDSRRARWTRDPDRGQHRLVDPAAIRHRPGAATVVRDLAVAPIRFLIHDRDSKFTAGFDEVFRSDGIRAIQTPVRAPRANAFIERWIGTLRRECLDRILIVNRRQLERLLPAYIRDYNEHRPHRSLDQRPPMNKPSESETSGLDRRPLARVATRTSGRCVPTSP